MKTYWFANLAQGTAKAAGASSAFIAICGITLVWMVTGLLFHWSDTWQLVINTVTNIVSMLMVFLIQNTQNRDDAAWIGVNVQEPLWNDRVTKAIDNQLTAKGWRKVDSGGDASISAVGATHTGSRIRHHDSRAHACWHAPYPYLRFSVKEGNLARRMYRYADGKSGEERKEVFRKFPPPEKG